MEPFNQGKEASVVKAMRTLKIKDSKLASVILKDNVVEESKLGNELEMIAHFKGKQQRKIDCEKERFLARYKRRMLRKSHSSSSFFEPENQRTCLFPPIKPGRVCLASRRDIVKTNSAPNYTRRSRHRLTESRVNKAQECYDTEIFTKSRVDNTQENECTVDKDFERQGTERPAERENKINEHQGGEIAESLLMKSSEKCNGATGNYNNDECLTTSSKPSKTALKRWKKAVEKTMVSQSRTSDGLPVNSGNGTKDPRFVQLVRQLVPTLEYGQSLKYTEKDLLDKKKNDTRDEKAFRDKQKTQNANQTLFKLAQQAQLYKAKLSTDASLDGTGATEDT
ncbi:uncharacterized protein LOC5519724 [Nematostella vectensis]|uniref:uncharacterized protein LOC5519724 n=1 Tax=Nematostella vectensis TaxID=45351 RepID=UPI002076E253|nr:uncharacterized protein LOC5519724 [Nematostella vectensis]